MNKISWKFQETPDQGACVSHW